LETKQTDFEFSGSSSLVSMTTPADNVGASVGSF